MFVRQIIITIFGLIIFISCGREEYHLTFPSDSQIAHRGYWAAGAPENSLRAVQYAIDAGIYGAEIDIHETKDNIYVVNHDDVYQGMHIPTSTYIDIISHTDGQIPLLEDFLNLLLKYPLFKLIIEIKSAHDLGILINIIEEYNISNQIEFMSFSSEYCEDIIDRDLKYNVGYLGDDLSPEYLANNNYDTLNASYHLYFSNQVIVEEAKRLGLRVYAWTVNNVNTMAMIYDLGIDCITTDYPRI